ncbi:type 1 fimbrial protein [Rosenbergiella australiborealis]|uniref:Type 1 fimbrial protein n=1 Tax=Rosenbergiella australiborealis TaxID=1544696 RepID=A0ABS5T6M5_9GAMM|nr:fimbrial protein [Rosenbergiella australiborealis]MBT0728011.1 type 1 fimbrial protein [Rosenbergiella australiborealis]
MKGFNKLAISYLLLVSVMSLPSTYAATKKCQGDCHIDVLFKGEYLAQTCRLSINQATSRETIALPVVSLSEFSIWNNELGETPFTLQLTGCPDKQTVLVALQAENGLYNSVSRNFKNTPGAGMSERIELRIRKENGEQLKVNQPDSGQLYKYASGANVESHQFTASYYDSMGYFKPTPGKLLVRGIVTINYQ